MSKYKPEPGHPEFIPPSDDGTSEPSRPDMSPIENPIDPNEPIEGDGSYNPLSKYKHAQLGPEKKKETDRSKNCHSKQFKENYNDIDWYKAPENENVVKTLHHDHKGKRYTRYK